MNSLLQLSLCLAICIATGAYGKKMCKETPTCAQCPEAWKATGDSCSLDTKGTANLNLDKQSFFIVNKAHQEARLHLRKIAFLNLVLVNTGKKYERAELFEFRAHKPHYTISGVQHLDNNVIGDSGWDQATQDGLHAVQGSVTDNAKWEAISDGKGFYSLINKQSKKAMGLTQLPRGYKVDMYPRNDNDNNQKWKLIPHFASTCGYEQFDSKKNPGVTTMKYDIKTRNAVEVSKSTEVIDTKTFEASLEASIKTTTISATAKTSIKNEVKKIFKEGIRKTWEETITTTIEILPHHVYKGQQMVCHVDSLLEEDKMVIRTKDTIEGVTKY